MKLSFIETRTKATNELQKYFEETCNKNDNATTKQPKHIPAAEAWKCR